MARVKVQGQTGRVVCKRAFRFGGRPYEVGDTFAEDTANLRKRNQLVSTGYLEFESVADARNKPASQAQEDGSIQESEVTPEVVSDNSDVFNEPNQSDEAEVSEGVDAEVKVLEVESETGSVEEAVEATIVEEAVEATPEVVQTKSSKKSKK